MNMFANALALALLVLPAVALAQAKNTLSVEVPASEEYSFQKIGETWVLNLPLSARIQGTLAVSGKSLLAGRQEIRVNGNDYNITQDARKVRMVFTAQPVAAVAVDVTNGKVAGLPGKAATVATANKNAEAEGAASQSSADTKAMAAIAAQNNYKKYTVDFTVPESPAFSLIGIAPEKITRPATPRDLAIAVANGVDEQGKAKSGLAIEFSPYELLYGQRVTLSDYAERQSVRRLMGTVVSLGVAKGTEATDKSMRMGVGLNISLFDFGDPRVDPKVATCLNTLKAPNRLIGAPVIVNEDTTAKQNEEFNACKSLANRAGVNTLGKWNKSAGSVGLGQAWTSETGTFSDKKRGARGGWLSLGYGFEGIRGLEDNAQLVAHVRRLFKEHISDPAQAGKFIDQDSTLAGARMRFTNDPSKFYGTMEGSYQRLEFPGGRNDKVKRFALGLEYKVSDDLWLVASVGGEGGRKDGENHAFVLGGFRFSPCNKSDCRLPK